MKLIDIVKDIAWPVGAACAVQDGDGEIKWMNENPALAEPDKNGHWWLKNTCDGSDMTKSMDCNLSEDWHTAIITKEMWEESQKSGEDPLSDSEIIALSQMLAEREGVDERAGTEEPPKPEIDWQRVVDEGFLVRNKSLDALFKLQPGITHDEALSQACNGVIEIPYGEIGIRLPHFGGEYPGHPDDLVAVKWRRGHYETGLAKCFFWGSQSLLRFEITEYIILEKGDD